MKEQGRRQRVAAEKRRIFLILERRAAREAQEKDCAGATLLLRRSYVMDGGDARRGEKGARDVLYEGERGADFFRVRGFSITASPSMARRLRMKCNLCPGGNSSN